MLKILFVDDDVIARRNMAQRLDWNSYGWELVYAARDGVDALDYMKNDQPDIVISDIKMPVMDGIEMARIAKDYYPDILFVFLTGYKEFEYAKQALALSAVDYLNKPIENEGLIKVLKHAQQQCLHNREVKRMINERYPLIKRHYISNLMYNSFKEADDEIFKAFDININNGMGIAMFMELNPVPKEEDELALDRFQTLCSDLTGRHRGSLFLGMEDFQMFIIYTESDCGVRREFEECINMLELEIGSMVKEQSGSTAVFYRGTVMNSINQLYESYQRALQEKNSRTHMMLAEVKSFIEKNFGNPDLSLTQVAEHFNINHCYLTRLYKDQFGVNLYDDLIQIRMEKAAVYLKTTDMRSYEIAEAVGYRNSQYFSMSFKKYYGCTVKDFKAGLST